MLAASLSDWAPYIGNFAKDNGYVAAVVREAFNRSGIVVVVLLLSTEFVILSMESGMIGFIIESLSKKEEIAFRAQAEDGDKKPESSSDIPWLD